MKSQDRIEALKRSKKYRKEYFEYEEYRKRSGINNVTLIDDFTPVRIISEEGQKLCKKYKIPFPIHPNAKMKVLPNNQWVPLRIEIPSVLPLPKEIDAKGKHIYGLVDAKYLKVIIDVEENEQKIFQDCKKLLEYFKGTIKFEKNEASRNRDTVVLNSEGKELTHWDIFDNAEEQKK